MCLTAVFSLYSSDVQAFGQSNQEHISPGGEETLENFTNASHSILPVLKSNVYYPLQHLCLVVLQDLLKTTPEEHRDYVALQEALRLSRSFLSGVNESSQCKREVKLSHGMVSADSRETLQSITMFLSPLLADLTLLMI